MRYNASLSVKNISVSRAGRTIIKDVSVSLTPGEAIVLRGPNGVGKTTLLRTLAGFIKPDGGEIKYDTGGKGVEETNLISYCGPLNAVKKVLTVDENLKFWCELYQQNATALLHAKEAMGLSAFADYPAGALSTGYARRLGLSRLLIAARPIWFVDEPTASLDAAAAEDFAALVNEHRAQGGAAIIATHDEIALENARSMRLANKEATS